MTSHKQQAANRRNALLSTGPRSAAGKAASSMNALTHGLTAATVVIEGEDPAAFAAMRDQLMDELAPQGTLAVQLVDRLAGILWRLRRIPQIEASLLEAHRRDAEQAAAERALRRAEDDCRKAHDAIRDTVQRQRYLDKLPRRPADIAVLEKTRKAKRRDLIKAEARRTSAGAMLGRAFRASLADLDTLGQLSRYESALVRQLEATLAQLKRAPAEWTGLPAGKLIEHEPSADAATPD